MPYRAENGRAVRPRTAHLSAHLSARMGGVKARPYPCHFPSLPRHPSRAAPQISDARGLPSIHAVASA